MSAQQVIELQPSDAGELQAAARDAYRKAAAAGQPPTGAELGRWFARSERWGCDRIAECRTHPDGNTPATDPPPPGSNGTHRKAVPVDDSGVDSGVTAERQSIDDDGSRPAAEVLALVAGGSRAAVPDGMWSRRIIRWVTTAAVIVVAACAARSSYEHQRTVVEMAGNPEAAWYLPLSVDGMMLIASLNMLVKRWDSQSAGALTWTALLLGGAASLAANIAAAEPTWIGRVVAAWSPVCLIVSYELCLGLLMQQLPYRAPATSTAAGLEGRQP